MRIISHPSSLLCGFALLVFAMIPANTKAQPIGRLVVLPYTTSPTSNEVLRAAEPVEAALSGRRADVISLHEARDRFTARSRSPSEANDSDVDILAREARNAIEHVAFGRSQAAQRSVREVLSRAERALESLNRETSTARQVLDACLALVRSALQQKDRRDALAQAMACRRLVPDVQPNENLHPASVVGVLAEADDQLRRLRTGRLSVTSQPQSSCSVYMNGRHLGMTPFNLERAAAGSYRVQVECDDARGRVHVVELGDEPVELVVDTEFDTAIHSEPRLLLRYPRGFGRDKLTHHAVMTGKAVRADDVVLVGIAGDSVQIERVNVRLGRVVARTHVPFSLEHGYDRPQLDATLGELVQGRIGPDRVFPPTDATPNEATSELAPQAALTLTSSSERKRDDRHPRQKTLLWVGGAVAVVGGGAWAMGLGYELRMRKLDRELTKLPLDDPKLDSKNSSFETARSLRWAAVAGGVLGTAAVPLLMEPRAKVPWWSYTLGGVGLALAGVGAWRTAIANDCELYDEGGICLATRGTEGEGLLMFSAAAPLIAAPISHLLRRPGVTVSTQASQEHAVFELRASF